MTRERERVAISFPDDGRTIQSEKDTTDINVIMAKFESDGMVDHVNEHQGQYGDVIGAVDYHTALNIKIDGDNAFQTLTAKVRKHFNNDPHEFLEAVSDPTREDEIRELGLLPPAKPLRPASEPAPAPEPTATAEPAPPVVTPPAAP